MDALRDKIKFLLSDMPGYAMSELLEVANQAGVRSVLIGERLTMISSSTAGQLSAEDMEHSLFTEFVLAGLEGGAAIVEQRLPIEPYAAEWQLLQAGKNSKVHLPLTKVELLVPIILFWGCTR
ncbi:MAG: hypothetical protein ACJAXW_003503 [Candidatus Azotimanducaceae bacterium]|jgi:hypothetical protein